MNRTIDQITADFDRLQSDVLKLINLDREIVEIAVKALTSVEGSLQKKGGLEKLVHQVAGKIQQLESIKSHDSLRSRYQVMFNQAIVLLVSYFATALADVFKFGISAQLDEKSEATILSEDVKLTFGEVKDMGWDLKEHIPDLLISRKGISFQDMQSILRTFEKYLNIKIKVDEEVNNIVFAQACRHVIVHSGGIVDQKLIDQISRAEPRRIKLAIEFGDHVKFAPDDVRMVANSMKVFVNQVSNAVR